MTMEPHATPYSPRAAFPKVVTFYSDLIPLPLTNKIGVVNTCTVNRGLFISAIFISIFSFNSAIDIFVIK